MGNINPKLLYALVIILILIVTGLLTYLKVLPQDLFISVFTLCIGNLSGVPINLNTNARAIPTTTTTTTTHD